MIYALKNHTDRTTIEAIKQAISEHDSGAIHPFVGKVIIHIVDAVTANRPFFCLYCQDEVFPTTARSPAGHRAKNPWHFEHTTNNKCIGVVNPCRHGCYVALGCENVTDRNRRNCQTIDKGSTYCHLGATLVPPCI
jgi:hypothetical protein